MDRARVAAIASFADLPAHELDAVARAAWEEVDVAAGEALTAEGEFGHSIFAIESGTAVVSTNGRPVAEVGPGDVVGEIAVLASGRRTASINATTPLRALALFKRDVWTLERDAPEAARRLRAALEQRERPI